MRADYESRTDFTEQEKVGLRFAERVTNDSNNVDEQLWAGPAQTFRRRTDRGVDDGGGTVQLLQPVQQRVADGADEVRAECESW